MSETLDVIGERLNARRVRTQVKDNIRDATIGRVEHMARQAVDRVDETQSSIMDTIRENPLPSAIAAVGLGWLYMNRRSHGGARRGEERARQLYAERAELAYGGETPAGGAFTGDQRLEYATPGYEATGPGAMARGQQQTGERAEGVKHAAADLKDRAQEVAGHTADRASHVASTVSTQAKERARRVEDRFQETPLAIGAVTFAVGLAAGMAMPPTAREVKLMGDTRDRVVDRAADVARETTDKVQQVASRVMDETRSTTSVADREQGSTV
jgi:ElaB/YqjD/DUF883 family membrane-anchored ribosome-binding protein